MFYDGQSDSLSSNALNRIKWEIAYNLLRGSCEDSAVIRSLLGQGETGKLTIAAPNICGGQQTTLEWYTKNENIVFRIFEVTQPK